MAETGALRVGLVGDRDDTVVAHRAIPLALRMAGEAVGIAVEPVWIPTDTVDGGAVLARFDGLWCVPASPYRDMDGALTAIRYAREKKRPFLDTCGGFQHAVIEYARNVFGWADADSAETAPEASRQVVVQLVCPLVEVADAVRLVSESRLARMYGRADIVEGYHCRYGLSREFRDAIAKGPLKVTATDDAGDVRGVELEDHPFFVATLFQHERGALHGHLPPPVHAFVQAMIESR